MEQHAVPQDITGFKFKLVGDMTLKQFGELAAGAIVAYMFYASSWHPFLKWPFVLLFGFFGVALAFIPIEERPLDLWILNFFRAIYHPTLYVWKRSSGGTDLSMTTKPPVQKPVVSVEPTEEADLGLTPWPFEDKKDIKEKKEESEPTKDKVETTEIEPQISETESTPPVSQQFSSSVADTAKQTAAPSPVVSVGSAQPSTPPPLSVEELQKLREQKITELEKTKQKLQEATREAKEQAYQRQVAPNAVTVDQLAKLREAKIADSDKQTATKVGAGEAQLQILVSQNRALVEQIGEIKNKIYALGGAEPGELKSRLDTLLSQRDGLSQKIKALEDQLAGLRAAPLAQPAYQPRVISSPTTGVKVMDHLPKTQRMVSLSDQPNIISGMVASEKGAPIDGVIVLIKDKAGNSIRALKTNSVGQFIVATPLPNGTYYVELEKQGYHFNTLEVTLSGQVLSPLEIPALPTGEPAQAAVVSN